MFRATTQIESVASGQQLELRQSKSRNLVIFAPRKMQDIRAVKVLLHFISW